MRRRRRPAGQIHDIEDGKRQWSAWIVLRDRQVVHACGRTAAGTLSGGEWENGSAERKRGKRWLSHVLYAHSVCFVSHRIRPRFGHARPARWDLRIEGKRRNASTRADWPIILCCDDGRSKLSRVQGISRRGMPSQPADRVSSARSHRASRKCPQVVIISLGWQDVKSGTFGEVAPLS